MIVKGDIEVGRREQIPRGEDYGGEGHSNLELLAKHLEVLVAAVLLPRSLREVVHRVSHPNNHDSGAVLAMPRGGARRWPHEEVL